MRCCVQGFTPRHTQLRRYKSSGAPSLDKPHRNPLMRWSEQLHHGWPIIHHLPQIFVGLEGCASAFNAMNAVRTCMYFGTASPPCFLTLRGPEDIQHLHPRSYSPCNDNDDGVNGTHSNKRTTIISSVARFGEDIFLNDPKSKHMPLLALENYTVRSKSLLACRFPDSGRLIIGHENRGVHRKYIGEHRTVSSKESGFAAEHVLYVPQYGTISSLNVVTSMGIALFYALMDTHFPQSRQVLSQPQSDSLSFTFNEDMDEVRNYQNLFQRSLPMVSSGSDTSRVDPRPIHPMYYQMNYEDIIQRHRRLRERLLQIEASGASRNDPALFGLSVLYQNAVDQRSLGGILRSANAFLVDAVYYFGRRKVNATGTIGTQHYTPPIYLGPHGHGALEDN
ncbi:hypothetical protein TRVL_04106 [Trypanosoma vivax]|nr:hypothetical protein TRVL_04106 [Trypanosoma vivax]